MARHTLSVRWRPLIAVIGFAVTLPACGSTHPAAAPSTSTTNPNVDRDPPDSRTPAAGACGLATGSVGNVAIKADFVPSPRCLVIRDDQRLSVTNETGQTIT